MMQTRELTGQPVLIEDVSALEPFLASAAPSLLYLWPGGSLLTDVKAALETAAKTYSGRLHILKIDLKHLPELAERFSVGKHPMAVALANGETITRRNRPWASDVQAIVELLVPYMPTSAIDDVISGIPTGTDMSDNDIISTKTSIKTSANTTDMQTSVAAQDSSVVLSEPFAVTDTTFERDVIGSELPVLVDFWAAWCGPCRQIAPIMDKLAAEFAGKVVIAKVDVDTNPGLSQLFGIQSIPTLMAVKSGKIVMQEAGAYPEHIMRDLLTKLVALEIPADPVA